MSEELKAAQARIACLEGEIAKRDAELAACRVAVENCELFRARIADLEHRCGMYGLELTNEVERRLQAERQLSALKAQGVVMPDVNAAAKALCNRHAMICGVDADDQWKEYSQDFIADAETVLANARLNATPVHQVSVTDGWRSMVDRLASTVEDLNEVARGQITDDMEDPDYEHGLCDKHDDLVREARAMLDAAPAAPAADAGLVDMYRHLQKVTPYRFKKIQDASITDGGDVMYFHADRFDSAVIADMAAHRAAQEVE